MRDFRELLSELNAHRVKYLVVGGYAVSFHTEPRFTKGLDIVIGSDPENSKAVYAALARFGAPLEGLKPDDLIEPGGFLRLGTPPVMVDILPTIAGVEFQRAWERRVEVAVDDSLTVFVISREDLLSAKIAAARPQDLVDAEALRQAQKQHEHARELAPRASPGAPDPVEEMKRKGREKWLERRAHEAGQSSANPDDKAKARDRRSQHDLDNDPE